MNATPPILQAPPVSDAAQSNAPASASSPSTRAGSQDFAAALSDAGGKPARKIAASKHQDPAVSGSSLPVPGNPPPPAQSPPPPAKAADPAAVAAAAVAAAAIADAAASAPPAGAKDALPGALAAASAAQANTAAAATVLTSENIDPAQVPGPAASLDATLAPSGAGPTAPDAALTLPHEASIATTPGTLSATSPAVPAGNARALGDATTSQAQSGLATSAASAGNAASSDSTLSSAPAAAAGAAAAGTDAAAQAVMAAAMAQGARAPSPDSFSSDETVIPETGASPGAAAPGNPAAVPGAALLQASAAATSAAVTAATAASVAQAVSAAASAGVADKRSHDSSPDSTPGASNDGSAGAAQLLTSNAPTDSTPMPTFKVAAGVDTAQFGQGVAERVSLMMDGNLTSAKLQVNPPALGPIEVRIALQGGHAQVWLSSHSAVTRDALESSAPKLREMLGSQGFAQVSVDISQRSFQERSPQSQAYEAAPAISAGAPGLAQAALPISRSASGLLDAYA